MQYSVGALLFMSVFVLFILVIMMGRLYHTAPDIMQPIVKNIAVVPQGRSCMEKEHVRQAAVSAIMNQSTQPDDPELIQAIAKHFIDPPNSRITKMSMPLFKTPQAEAVDGIFHQKKSGFFVECGGLDGERSSNTIFFEQKRGWTGLLIEMDPSWYMQLQGKNRKSFSINACISPYHYPTKMDFKEHQMGEGKLVVKSTRGVEQPVSPAEDPQVHSVYCFPFYSMMLALNTTHIDYFSLDVEGFELSILKTIPFEMLDISVFSVEYAHAKDGGEEYIKFMAQNGYTLHSRVERYKPEIYFGCKDFIFVKQGISL